jgi:hypothetical protein
MLWRERGLVVMCSLLRVGLMTDRRPIIMT